MRYRMLGKTGLKVSEIGLGGEWLERHNAEEVKAVVDRCAALGINILDCWMSEPNVRSNIGAALEGQREKWYIQGHIGSTWQNGQYVRTRALPQVKAAFEDLLARMRTDYVHEQQERYRTQLTHLTDAIEHAGAAERVKLTKQQKKFQDQATELQKYEEKVHHLADQNIEIDLDDGVKHNYELFADVLAKIK